MNQICVCCIYFPILKFIIVFFLLIPESFLNFKTVLVFIWFICKLNQNIYWVCNRPKFIELLFITLKNGKLIKVCVWCIYWRSSIFKFILGFYLFLFYCFLNKIWFINLIKIFIRFVRNIVLIQRKLINPPITLMFNRKLFRKLGIL